MKLKIIKATILTNFLLSFLTAITSVIIARMYGAAVRGDYASLMALINLTVGICSFGTPTFLANYRSDFNSSENDCNMLFVIAKIVLTSGIVSIAFFWIFIGHFVEARISVLCQFMLTSYLPISICSVLMLNMSLGQMNWRSFNISKLMYGVLNLVLVLIFYSGLEADFQYLIWAIWLSNIFTLASQIYLSEGTLARGNVVALDLKTVYAKSKDYALNSLVSVATGQADVLVFSMLSNSVNVGLWAVARTVAALISPVNQALSNWVFSMCSNRQLKDGIQFAQVARIFFAVNIISGCVLVTVSSPIINLVFGVEFGASCALVPFAVIGVMMAAFSEMVEERFRGYRNAKPVTKMRSIPLFVFVVMALLSKGNIDLFRIGMFYCLGQILRFLYALYSVSKVDDIWVWQYVFMQKKDFKLIMQNIVTRN